LTIPLSPVALPAHAHQKYGTGIQLPVLMRSGTFAVEPEPWGTPWRRWEEIAPDEAAARGIYAPLYALSDSAPGTVVIAPGDARGTVLVPNEADGYCCGLDWGDGPNMACEACGLPVASRIDDCSLWQAVWLAPDAVHCLPVDDTDSGTAILSWEELLEEGEPRPRSNRSPDGARSSGWTTGGHGARSGKRQPAGPWPTCWPPPTADR
jgi:hypothetical protein